MCSMKRTVTNTDMAQSSRALCTTQIYKTLIMTSHFGPRESKQGTRLSDINMAETKSLWNVCSHGCLRYKGAQILRPSVYCECMIRLFHNNQSRSCSVAPSLASPAAEAQAERRRPTRSGARRKCI